MIKKIQIIDINYLSEIAQISLKEEEKDHFKHEINKKLSFFSKINFINVTGINPMQSPFLSYNVWDYDIPKRSYSTDTIKINSCAVIDNQIVVPKIID